MVLKLIGVNASAPFPPILNNMPVKLQNLSTASILAVTYPISEHEFTNTKYLEIIEKQNNFYMLFIFFVRLSKHSNVCENSKNLKTKNFVFFQMCNVSAS